MQIRVDNRMLYQIIFKYMAYWGIILKFFPEHEQKNKLVQLFSFNINLTPIDIYSIDNKNSRTRY